MKKTNKSLKEVSVLILILAGFSLFNVLINVFFGDLKFDTVPDGMTEGVYYAALGIILALGLLLLLPQIYIGVKGIKVSGKPDSSRGHIVWAKILLVLSVIALAEPVTALVKGGVVIANVLDILDILIDVTLYFMFVKYAGKIAKER